MSLFEACGNGYYEIAKKLIDEGADVNSKSIVKIQAKFDFIDYEYTPLMNASRNGHKEVCALLIEKGADINLNTNYRIAALFGKTTALIEASTYGKKEICELLIENGAEINHPPKYGYDALQQGIKSKSKETCIYLIEKGAYLYSEYSWYNPLIVAFNQGNKETFEFIFEKVMEQIGGEKNETNLNKFGVNELLIDAVRKNDFDLCKFLIEYGVNVNYQDEGLTPLLQAVAVRNKEILELLIANGANVNAIEYAFSNSQPGNTAFSILFEENYEGDKLEGSHEKKEEICKILISHGANVNIKHPWDKSTPLTYVTGNKELCELLIKNGAKIEVCKGKISEEKYTELQAMKIVMEINYMGTSVLHT
jgi:ankyrin repeat protein